MHEFRAALATFVIFFLAVGSVAVLSAGTARPQTSGDEQTLWNLEHAYWRHVQDNDLPTYLALWSKDFLGWPSVSSAPVRKEHITDWITSQTSKGLAFKSVDFKPAAIQVTGNMAVTFYWETFKWFDKNGDGATRTLRVTHTWMMEGKDWHIISGMSMPEAAIPQK